MRGTPRDGVSPRLTRANRDVPQCSTRNESPLGVVTAAIPLLKGSRNHLLFLSTVVEYFDRRV